MSFRRVLFLGSKRLGLACLSAMTEVAPSSLCGIITIDDSDDSRGIPDEFAVFSRSSGIPLSIARNRRQAEDAIIDTAPDLCLVVGWYWILGAGVVEAVPGGMLGLHNSLLPRYRGGAPLVWAMINGETEVGASLFTFTDEVDAGDVRWQVAVPVRPEDYISDVLEKLERASADKLAETYGDILAGRITPRPQDGSLATTFPMRRPEDGRIDWTSPAAEIFNFVRAQSKPYPCAFTTIGGRRVKVWRARALEGACRGEPGEVVEESAEGIRVACGDGRPLLLEEIEDG